MSKRSPLAIIFITIFIDLMGFGAIIPLLPNLSVELTGSEAAVAVAGVYALFSFLFSPFWGTLSDRYGRRPVILISTLLMAGANFLFGFIEVFWMLALQRALAGIASGNISVATAYIADVSGPENRAKNMALVGAAFGMGFIFGPVIGGVLAEWGGYMAVGAFSAGLSLANFVLAYFILPESLKEKDVHAKFQFKPVTQLINALKIPIVRELLILNFVFTVAFSMMQLTAAILWEKEYGLSEAQRGYVFTFIGLASALVQGLLVGRLNKAFGERKLLYAGMVLMGIGLIAIPFPPAGYFWLELVALGILALAAGCITPSILSLLAAITSPREQGKIMGINQSVGSLSRVFGPLFGGLAYTVNFHLPYLVGGAICFAALLLVNDLMKKKKTASG